MTPEEFALLSEDVYRAEIEERNIIRGLAADLINKGIDGEAARILSVQEYVTKWPDVHEQDVERRAIFERERALHEAIIAKTHELYANPKQYIKEVN